MSDGIAEDDDHGALDGGLCQLVGKCRDGRLDHPFIGARGVEYGECGDIRRQAMAENGVRQGCERFPRHIDDRGCFWVGNGIPVNVIG